VSVVSGRLPRRGLGLVLAALAGLPSAASAQTPPCSADPDLEPVRAVVGQQVLYRVEIRSREDVDLVEWRRQPAFAEIRTERIPGGPQPEVVAADGTRLRVRVEQRALFGERAGRFVLRSAGLRCRLRGGARFEAPVAASVLELVEPPAEERPPGYTGLVGPLSLQRTVSPERVVLGESVRIAVVLLGEGNLWDAPPPFAASAFADADLFARRPELRLERGSRLFVRRRFVYDVVPRHAGAFEVPGIEIPYFDPLRGRYAAATAAPTRVDVAPRAADATSAPGAAPRPPGRAPESGATRAPLPWALVVVGVLAAGACLAVLRRRRDLGTAAILAEARAAHAAGDPEAEATALARALRASLSRHVADSAVAAPEELAARRGLPAPVAAAAHILAGVERARFDPESPPPDAVAVERAIAELEAIH
jgi:hypothetical protein